jgi:hypothetical protein
MKKPKSKDDLLHKINNLLIEHVKGNDDPEKAVESIWVLTYCLCCVTCGMFNQERALEVISTTVNSLMPKVAEIKSDFDHETILD